MLKLLSSLKIRHLRQSLRHSLRYSLTPSSRYSLCSYRMANSLKQKRRNRQKPIPKSIKPHYYYVWRQGEMQINPNGFGFITPMYASMRKFYDKDVIWSNASKKEFLDQGNAYYATGRVSKKTLDDLVRLLNA